MNHISIVCRSLEKSLDFYQNVLGFFPVRRPSSLNFDGAWYIHFSIRSWVLFLSLFLASMHSDQIISLMCTYSGCSVMALAYIYCNLKTLKTCPRLPRLIPRTTTSLSKYLSIAPSLGINPCISPSILISASRLICRNYPCTPQCMRNLPSKHMLTTSQFISLVSWIACEEGQINNKSFLQGFKYFPWELI